MLHIWIENLREFEHAWHQATDRLVLGIQRGVEMGCKEGAQEALRSRKWKNRTGAAEQATRGHLEQKFNSGATGVIECRVPYASYLDEGTKPHEIWPKTAICLRWYDEGGDAHFAKHVNHPGTKGDGFMGKAYEKCERVVIRETYSAIEQMQKTLDAA